MSMFRRGPKRASRVEEKKLIESAKLLAKDPMKVIPECGDSCFLCKFGRAKRKIKKIKKYKDDEDKLKKYSKRGPGLSKATAGTLLLALKEEAPLLARAKIPGGEISYAKRGDATKERLIGVQHFKDPTLRLLAYSKEAEKGYYFYSWNDNVVCTGKKDDPPKGYIKNVISNFPYNIKKGDGGYTCGHTKKNQDRSYFTMRWKGAGIKFSICNRCASGNTNLFHYISKGMMSKDNTNSFSIESIYKMKCRADCSTCQNESRISLPDKVSESYYNNKLSDSSLIRKIDDIGWEKKKKQNDVYAIDGVCYGNDMGAFLRKFDYEEWEADAIKKAIESQDGIVLEEGTVNELLQVVWETEGIEILMVITGDEKTAKKIYEEGEEEGILPRDSLRKAKKIKKVSRELEKIPEFKELPPKAKFVNDLVLTYKTEGEEAVVKKIDGMNLSDTRVKSIAYGFLTALGKGSSKKWKYSQSEVDSGEFMVEYIEKLLDSSGKEYAQALQDLVKVSGSTAVITMKNGTKLR